MIIDQLTSHGDRITYRPHLIAGKPVPSHVARAKEAAAGLFGVHSWELLESSVGTRLLTWRARGKRAPSIVLTRPTSMLQAEGGLNAPAGESGPGQVVVMMAHTAAATRAARTLLGYPKQAVHHDGAWTWTVDLSKA